MSGFWSSVNWGSIRCESDVLSISPKPESPMSKTVRFDENVQIMEPRDGMFTNLFRSLSRRSLARKPREPLAVASSPLESPPDSFYEDLTDCEEEHTALPKADPLLKPKEWFKRIWQLKTSKHRIHEVWTADKDSQAKIQCNSSTGKVVDPGSRPTAVWRDVLPWDILDARLPPIVLSEWASLRKDLDGISFGK